MSSSVKSHHAAEGIVELPHEPDWQRCRFVVETYRSAVQGTPRQAHIEALRNVLETLRRVDEPSREDTRQMAKLLGVPQRKHGNKINAAPLLQDVKQNVLKSVHLLQKHHSILQSAEPEAVSAQDTIQRILQDVRKLGRPPKEIHSPSTAAEFAERKLARQGRTHKLQDRLQETLSLQTPRVPGVPGAAAVEPEPEAVTDGGENDDEDDVPGTKGATRKLWRLRRPASVQQELPVRVRRRPVRVR